MKNWQTKFASDFGTETPIMGMVHLKPLPGSPLYDADKGMEDIIETALTDTRALNEGGVDAIQIENQFDRPFLKGEDVGFETVAAITAATEAIKRETKLPLGINVHLNGVNQAIAIALATGCRWIRAFELANAYVSNSGIVEAAGPAALRYRSFLKADDKVMIFGDFHVKHGSHALIEDRSLEEQAEDVETSMGDALIVTGLKTGSAPSLEDIQPIRNAVSIPILIGSGLSYDNLDTLLPAVNGAIVGSSFKKDGKLTSLIDAERVKKFMDKVRSIRTA